jgi:N-acyl homoserine lactone hydrolase
VRLDDVRAIQYGDVLVEGERWPNCIHVIDHPDGRVLVDTGMIDSTPELDEEWGVRFDPELIPRDVVCVINTHLHFDHCGGNRLFPGVPIHVQRAELAAIHEPDYTIAEWVEFEGANYVEHDGAAEILPGVRLVPTPGHSPGHQSVLVDTEDGLVVAAGDVGYTWGQFDRSESGQMLSSLHPRRIWLAHSAEPRDLG